MNKAQKTRLIMMGVGLVVAVVALYWASTGLREQASLFQSPSDIQKLSPETKQEKTIRLGGLVLENSLKTLAQGEYEFQITDYQNDVTVRYKGLLPDLFREGQGVYVDGAFDEAGKIFIATTVLAKHDEKYTPPMPGEGE
jgi:cytochrome c-type biogenesis protein CcmE